MSKAPAVDYALKIIEFIATSNEPVGITDICNGLDINKNAISRVLEALLEQKWIYLSDATVKKYSLTVRPFSVIAGNVEENKTVKIAKPYLEDLRNRWGDSSYLGVKNGNNVLYEAHFNSLRDVRINGCVGGEYPLHCSAPGKILLAYGKENEARAYFENGAVARSENTITDYNMFALEAEKIRERGYALDNEEFARGIICIACPVFDGKGEVAASVGISSLTIYDTVETLAEVKFPVINQIAKDISESLGYRGNK